mmetsp:Transcript_1646/g.4062  ORF Transcript_1646/g.4062 Transcript_1646/m.4062 type:complete len:207 (+) Transcript_1646:138-758(+)
MRADAAAEADALDHILGDLPDLDGPWQCCILTDLPPLPPSTPVAAPAANSACPLCATVRCGPAATLSTPAHTSLSSTCPSSYSFYSSSSIPTLTAVHQPSAVADTASAAITAAQAARPAVREHKVLQLLAATAGWPHNRNSVGGNASSKGQSTSCQQLPTPSPCPPAEPITFFSAPCTPLHMDAQRKRYCSSSLARSSHAHHVLRS